MKIWEAIKYPVGTKFKVINYNMWSKIEVSEVGKTKTLFWDASSVQVAITEQSTKYELEIVREEITWQEALEYKGDLILDIEGIEGINNMAHDENDYLKAKCKLKEPNETGDKLDIMHDYFKTIAYQEIIIKGKWYKV